MLLRKYIAIVEKCEGSTKTIKARLTLRSATLRQLKQLVQEVPEFSWNTIHSGQVTHLCVYQRTGGKASVVCSYNGILLSQRTKP